MGGVSVAIILLVITLTITINIQQPHSTSTAKPKVMQKQAQPTPLKIQKITLPTPPALAMPAPMPTPAVKPLQPQQQAQEKTVIKPLDKAISATTPLNVTPLQQSSTAIKETAKAKKSLKPLQKKIQKKQPTQEKQKPKSPIKNVNADMINQGHVALQQIEKGKGPSIEIAFPAQMHDRVALFHQLHQCYGMEIALLNDKGKLYHLSSQSGQAWQFNQQYYSQMLRAVHGESVDAEINILNAIRQHHQLSVENTQAVRILPRQIDAIMIGALLSLASNHNNKNINIKAHYDIENQQIYLHDININGQYFNDKIALSTQCL